MFILKKDSGDFFVKKKNGVCGYVTLQSFSFFTLLKALGYSRSCDKLTRTKVLPSDQTGAGLSAVNSNGRL